MTKRGTDLPFALPATTPAARARARRIDDALANAHPDAHCELNWGQPHELLFATILSAQCTDVAVNRATESLFSAFPTVENFAQASPEMIGKHIKTIGLHRNKAKFLHGSACLLLENHQGEVPQTLEDLVALPGVARKTANVVLGNAFGLNVGVVVDTHVSRLSTRFGLTTASTPLGIEKDLMALFPRERWCMLSHRMIFHGRRVCKARHGRCQEDPLCQRYCSEAASVE
ncbi:MAG: endonuclease III [Phycisphaerae bacterium]|nr:endonuclease III [Phycisphaerae bacterium]